MRVSNFDFTTVLASGKILLCKKTYPKIAKFL